MFSDCKVSLTPKIDQYLKIGYFDIATTKYSPHAKIYNSDAPFQQNSVILVLL